MNHTTSPINRPFNVATAIIIAISAVMIFVSSFNTADAVAPVHAKATTQALSTAAAQPQTASATPASMNYHDGINVAAIAVAAYDR